jgi:hypothetical protein
LEKNPEPLANYKKIIENKQNELLLVCFDGPEMFFPLDRRYNRWGNGIPTKPLGKGISCKSSRIDFDFKMNQLIFNDLVAPPIRLSLPLHDGLSLAWRLNPKRFL